MEGPGPLSTFLVHIHHEQERAETPGNDGRERRGFTRMTSRRNPAIKFQLVFVSGRTGPGDDQLPCALLLLLAWELLIGRT